MNVRELSGKYDWQQYCICCDLDEERGWGDLKEFGIWLFETQEDLKDDYQLEIQIYTRRCLGDYFPTFEDLLEDIEDHLQDCDCLYGIDGERLNQHADGLEDFKKAYQQFCNCQRYFNAEKEVERCEISVRELKELVQTQNAATKPEVQHV